MVARGVVVASSGPIMVGERQLVVLSEGLQVTVAGLQATGRGAALTSEELRITDGKGLDVIPRDKSRTLTDVGFEVLQIYPSLSTKLSFKDLR